MGLRIQGIPETFEGPFSENLITEIRDDPGAYVITSRTSSIRKVDLIDVGDAGQGSQGLHRRLSDHDRKNCWKGQDPNYLIYVHYTTYQNAYRLATTIKNRFNVSCGEK